MKKIKKNIIASLFCCLMPLSSTLALADSNDSFLEPARTIENSDTKQQNSNYFNLANIVDGILNPQDQNPQYSEADIKTTIRKDFISATAKFNQGNSSSAYDDYNVLLDKIESDNALLALSKIFYEIGFFSLGDKAANKIVSSINFQKITADLRISYKPKANLTTEDEIYFAKQNSNIYFENNTQETLNELLKNKKEDNDYYYYTLAKAYLELKQYSKAISSINSAISLNPQNINYKSFKIDILTSEKKYSSALATIKKLEKNKNMIVFKDEIEIKKQTLLAAGSKKDADRKYHLAEKSFLEGNFEKAKKDCLSVLNFDKNNDKIIALYAKSELASGNIERANVYFTNAHKINKNNKQALVGLGDIRYIHGDYKNSIKAYKKARRFNSKNSEITIKLYNAQQQGARKPKDLIKSQKLINKLSENCYIDYYKTAVSLAQKKPVLKEEYLKRSLEINPLYSRAIGELVKLNLKNRNLLAAKGLIYNASFTLEKNYYYYYLLGLYSEAMNNTQDAMEYYKTSLNLNPSFEIANIKLLNLIPSKINIQGEEI